MTERGREFAGQVNSRPPVGRQVVMARRCMLITDTITILDEQHIADGCRTTPPGALDSLGELLTKVAPQFRDEGVILLDPNASDALGITHGGQLVNTSPDTNTAIRDARTHGWVSKHVSAWMRFTSDKHPEIHVALYELAQTDKAPLLTAWPPDAVRAFAHWHNLTGYAYRGTPGTAGIDALMAMLETRHAGRVYGPSWRAWAGPRDGGERWYTRGSWSRYNGRTFRQGFDLNRAYGAAMGNAMVSPVKLRHEPQVVDFDPARAGWWLTVLDKWADPRMPDPAGPGTHADVVRSVGTHAVVVRWLTTPRLRLLAELRDQGVHPGFQIEDAWLGPATQLFKKWSMKMEKAFQAAASCDDDSLVSKVVQDAIKRAQTREVYGGMKSTESGWIRRPDWWAAIVATHSTNLWRKCWEIGQRTDVWPLYIETDCLWYGSDAEDPTVAAKDLSWTDPVTHKKRGIILGESLGQFHPKGTIAEESSNE